MTFNKFDRVQWINKKQTGMIVENDGDGNYLVCFDNEFSPSEYSKLHNGREYKLNNGTNPIDLKLPNRCQYVSVDDLKLIMLYGEKIEYVDDFGNKNTGKYIATGIHKYKNKLLIESDDYYTHYPEQLRTCGIYLKSVCNINKLLKIDINRVKTTKENKLK